MARQPHRDFEGDRRALIRVGERHTDLHRAALRGFLDEQPPADAVDRQRDRRKVDHDLIGEAPPIDNAVVDRHEHDGLTAEGAKGVSGHRVLVR
jgi:hypothetical protein